MKSDAAEFELESEHSRPASDRDDDSLDESDDKNNVESRENTENTDTDDMTISYQLHVSSGTGYKDEERQPVRVNRELSEYQSLADNVRLAVRIQDFTGHASRSCEYFSLDEHKKEQLSIQIQITFDEDVNGNDLLWGNDFDHPIRDMLPWGFSVGFGIMKRYIDPSIEGDPYSDAPYLYGRALVSMNKMVRNDDTGKWAGYIAEDRINSDSTNPPVPKTASARSRHFNNEATRKQYTFRAGETYSFDFFTPYITLGKRFAIKLPGYNLGVEKYCGSQPLRYVLKDQRTGRALVVVQFDLVKI